MYTCSDHFFWRSVRYLLIFQQFILLTLVCSTMLLVYYTCSFTFSFCCSVQYLLIFHKFILLTLACSTFFLFTVLLSLISTFYYFYFHFYCGARGIAVDSAKYPLIFRKYCLLHYYYFGTIVQFLCTYTRTVFNIKI